MIHRAIISDRAAACSCKRWNGPTRRVDEPQGPFTTRAFAAHLDHVATDTAPRSEQCGLFDMQPDLFSGIRI